MARHDHFDDREDLHRRADPRAARHHTRAQLTQLGEDDPEPVIGRSMRSGNRTHVVGHDKGKLEKTARGTPKVWKSAFWKRRTNARQEKARLARAVALGGE